MTPRLVTAGAIVTAFTVVAAAVAVWSQPRLATVDLADEPAFPGLRSRPDAVVSITVTGADGPFTVARDEGGRWVVRERNDYPAAADRIRALVGSLADMRLAEPKTAKPERFPRLEVEDVDAENARSRHVRLEAADGGVLADAVIGKRVFSYTGGREAGTYLRRSDDERAWLASGGLVVGADVAGWLERAVLDIPADEIRRIAVAPAEGEPYAVARAGEDEGFSLEPVPEGRRVAADAIGRLTDGFADLQLEDVAPKDTIALPPDAAEATVETWDGRRVAVRYGVVDDAPWAVFAVTGAEGAADSPEAGADADTGAALAPWAFRVSETVAGRLAPARETLLEPSESAPERP